MEQQKKRERALNFTQEETECLINLVVKYSNVIENKISDTQNWKDKEYTWKKLCLEFNAISGKCPRTVKALKNKYESFKKDLKKKKSFERQKMYKTGGGDTVDIKYTPAEEKLLAIISLNVDGLQSRNDCDEQFQSLTINNKVSNGNSEFAPPITLNLDVIELSEAHASELNTSPLNHDINENSTVVATEKILLPEIDSDEIINLKEKKGDQGKWSKLAPKKLRQPVSASLKISGHKSKIPVVKSEYIENLSSLSKIKTELLHVQKENISHEACIKKRILEDEEKQTSLNYEIMKLKRQKIEIELEVASTDRDLKKIQLDNEKIKNKILYVEHDIKKALLLNEQHNNELKKLDIELKKRVLEES